MFQEQKEGKRLFGSDSSMGLFVALYLILLAFFIILTSVSEQAASRGLVVMDSVNSTFQRTGQADRPNLDPRAEIAASNDPVLKSIQRSFFSELEIPGRFSEAGGGYFEVQFPETFLFQPGSFRVRQDMNPFLDQLVAALQDNSQEGRQEVAFLFGAGVGSVDREATRSQEVAIRRAGSLARYLQTAGLEKDVFVTGFVGLPEGEMMAVFRRTFEKLDRSPLGVGGGSDGQ